jgi:hypothetical protein
MTFLAADQLQITPEKCKMDAVGVSRKQKELRGSAGN